MNTNLNLMLAQMLNQQQVERSTNERLMKEIQNAETGRNPENSQA